MMTWIDKSLTKARKGNPVSEPVVEDGCKGFSFPIIFAHPRCQVPDGLDDKWRSFYDERLQYHMEDCVDLKKGVDRGERAVSMAKKDTIVAMGREEDDRIRSASSRYTMAEKHAFLGWRFNDPVTVSDILSYKFEEELAQKRYSLLRDAAKREMAVRQAKEDIRAEKAGRKPKKIKRKPIKDPETGKKFAWPKLEMPEHPFDTYSRRVEAPKEWLGATFKSCVYDELVNKVSKAYRNFKFRRGFLLGERSVPQGRHLRLRVRNKNSRVIEIDEDAKTATIELNIFQVDSPLVVTLDLNGCAPEIWLHLWGKHNDGFPMQAITVSEKCEKGKRGRKSNWSLSCSRKPYVKEIGSCVKPVSNRVMVCIAPSTIGTDKKRPDRVNFLLCSIHQERGENWNMKIPGAGLKRVKERSDYDRRSMRRNWKQSPGSAVHGRGLRRCLDKQDRLSRNYWNLADSFLEERSAVIVKEAKEQRCAVIAIEDFQKRKSTARGGGLLFGPDFRYYDFVERLKQKANQVGIEVVVGSPDIDQLVKDAAA